MLACATQPKLVEEIKDLVAFMVTKMISSQSHGCQIKLDEANAYAVEVLHNVTDKVGVERPVDEFLGRPQRVRGGLGRALHH